MRHKGDLGTAAMRKAYAAKHGSVDANLFASVTGEFNKELLALLLRGVELRLPMRLGTFYVQKKIVNFNNLALDYGHWQKTGAKLYHTNRHSDGYRAKYHWKKALAVLPGKGFYAFTPCRAAKRELAAILKSEGGHKRYQLYTSTPRPRATSLN